MGFICSPAYGAKGKVEFGLADKGKRRTVVLMAWLGLVGITATVHAALGCWPASVVAANTGLPALGARALCIGVVGLGVSLLYFVGYSTLRFLWQRRAGAKQSTYPTQPMLDPPGVTQDQLLGAFCEVFRWFLETIRITMRDIARERIICGRARRHHRDTLRSVKEVAKDRSEELKQWANSSGERWREYSDIFGKAVVDLDIAIKPLERRVGRSASLMMQAAGKLYAITDELSASYNQLRRDRKRAKQ